jgi:hypothetical protein
MTYNVTGEQVRNPNVPLMKDGQYPVGQITAVDVATGNTVWQYQQHAYNYSAVLATAGNLVFNGDGARYFFALDTETGKQVWNVRLGSMCCGYPVTYSVNGRQYVAVVAGYGRNSLAPEIDAVDGDNMVYVRVTVDHFDDSVSCRRRGSGCVLEDAVDRVVSRGGLPERDGPFGEVEPHRTVAMVAHGGTGQGQQRRTPARAGNRERTNTDGDQHRRSEREPRSGRVPALPGQRLFRPQAVANIGQPLFPRSEIGRSRKRRLQPAAQLAVRGDLRAALRARFEVPQDLLVRLHKQFLADERVGQIAEFSALHCSVAPRHLRSAAFRLIPAR